MLDAIYNLHFSDGRLRWKIFMATVLLGTCYGELGTALFHRSEERVVPEAILLMIGFFVVYPVIAFAFKDLATLPKFARRMQEATRLLTTGQPDKAYACYSRLLAAAPLVASRKDRLELLVSFAITCRAVGDAESMISALEHARKLSKSLGQQMGDLALYLLAEGYLEIGNRAKSSSLFEEFLALHQRLDWKKIESLLHLYTLYREVNDLERADLYEKEALRLLKQLPDLRMRYFERAMLTFQVESE